MADLGGGNSMPVLVERNLVAEGAIYIWSLMFKPMTLIIEHKGDFKS